MIVVIKKPDLNQIPLSKMDQTAVVPTLSPGFECPEVSVGFYQDTNET